MQRMRKYRVWKLATAIFGAILFSTASAQTSSVLTSPANGGSNLDPTVPITFTWKSVSNALSYTLDVGTTPGAQDAYTSGAVQSTSEQVQLQASTTYYATIWTKEATGSYSNSISFSTNTGIGRLTAPLNGATNVDPFAPITWSGPPDALSYALYISTKLGGTDLYFSYSLPPATKSRLPWGLQPNTTYYARLYTKKADGQHYEDIQFQTTSSDALPNQATFYSMIATLTAQVRAMTAGSTNNALSGTVLYQVMLDRSIDPTKSGADCTSFAFALLNVLSTNHLLARYRAITLNGVISHAIVEYWDPFNAKWSVADSTFGLIYFDDNTQTGWSADDISQALRGGNVSSIPMKYVAPYYDSFMRNYYMDPITLYNNVVPMGSDNISSAVNSPQSFLNAQSVTAATGQPNIYTAWFANPTDSFSVQNGSLGAVTFKPYQTSSWSTEAGLYKGWTELSVPPSSMQFYSYKWMLSYNGLAGLISPRDRSTGVNSSSGVQFSWNPIADAGTYRLQVGRSSGGTDVYDSGETQANTVNVAVQPSTTYYVRLWTEKPTGWFYADTTFQTAAAPSQTASTSYLITPANEATVSPETQFSWTPVPNVTYYQLYLGSSVGASDYYNSYGTTATSLALTLQPSKIYYARLWTFANNVTTHTDSTFQTSSTSYLITPGNGITVSPQTQFTWTSVLNVLSYTLWIGTSPGARDAFYYTTAHSSPPTATSVSATLLPGTTYYARLWTQSSAGFTYTDSTFQTSSTSYLITPGNGTTVSPQTQFTWTSVLNVLSYTLWIGTSPGARDAFYYTTAHSSPPTATSVSATLLPGTTYYARLWTQSSAGFTYTDSTFQTSSTSYLITPGNGTTVSPQTRFTWTSVPNVTYYQLYLGSSIGASDDYNSYGTSATSLSLTLQPNKTYYARLWTFANNVTTHTDSVFSTTNPLANLTYPLNGATNVNPFLPFTWTQPQAATAYLLTVSPTGYGVEDFFIGVQYIIPTVSSQYVWGLQPNTKYYVQLCTGNAGGGGCTDTSFSTGAAPALPSNRNAFYQTVQNLTSSVRLMTQGFSNNPIPGSALYQFIANHAGDPTQPTQCGWFAATLLDQLTQNGILARHRGLSVDGGDAHVLTEYWDPFNQKWQIADPTFGLVYFDPNSQIGQSMDDVNSLLLSNNLSAIKTLFLTNYGSQYMTTYYLDPITLYTNVIPFSMLNAQDELNYVPNSPLSFLNDITSTAPGTGSEKPGIGRFVFHFANQTDSVTIQSGGSAMVVSPLNTEGWAGSVYLQDGWSFASSVPSGMHIYTFKRILF